MICLLIERGILLEDLKENLEKEGAFCRILSVSEKRSLDYLYSNLHKIEAVIASSKVAWLPELAWHDLLESLARKIPVFVMAQPQRKNLMPLGLVINIETSSAQKIIQFLRFTGVLGKKAVIEKKHDIAAYNQNVALQILRRAGALSILTINCTDFRKVAVDYGAESYIKLQEVFQDILIETCGDNFTPQDFLFRLSPISNIYVILLDVARVENIAPPPGLLEKLADNLIRNLQRYLWIELLKKKPDRLLPDSMLLLPKVSVGYATALYNPCMEPTEIIDQIFESCDHTAKVQSSRSYDRLRHMLQAFIQTKDVLIPHYQGVFDIRGLSREMVEQAINEESIAPLAGQIYAFESLIRFDLQQAEKIINQDGPLYFSVNNLRPDIIFALAASVKLSLELDQACLLQAAHNFSDLPGRLMANILPRNFYYIAQLEHLIPPGTHLTFEVAESEAINNFALLVDTKKKLAKKDHQIAIDDFGKGYAGLDRIIEIKPDIIKFDRSLVTKIHEDRPKRAFVSGLVKTAKLTNSVVLAEGVEKIEEMLVLQEMGVDLIQGFLLHRPQLSSKISEDLKIARDFGEIAS